MNSDAAKNNLKGKTSKGMMAMLGNQVGKFILKLISIGVLARILSPEDYGLIAMIAVLLGVFTVFRDAGLSQATVQKHQITDDQLSTLFWINSALGVILAILLVAISPLIAWFYKDERLLLVTCALAPTFILSGLSVQFQAILRRRMQFGSLAIADNFSSVIGIICGIIMALRGYGYWALVAIANINALTGLIFVWYSCHWTPGRPIFGNEIKSIIRFGSNILVFDFVNFFSRQADNLLIGWRWGAIELGFYDKAYKLLLEPIIQINAPLTSVLVPALSRLQNDPERFTKYYTTLLKSISSLCVPIILALGLFAPDIISLWLGPNWSPCIKTFQILSPAALFGALANPVGSLLIPLGRTKTYMCVGAAAAILYVLAFLAGLPYGMNGVATAYSIAQAVAFLPVWYFATRNSPISMALVLKSFAPPLAAGVAGIAIVLILRTALPQGKHEVLQSSIQAVIFILVYLILLLGAFKHWSFVKSISKDLKAGLGTS